MTKATFPEAREAPMSTCCTCGFQWRTGTHGGHSCAEQMGKTIDAQAAEIERLREALRGLDEAYCRAGMPLSRDERNEDRRRLMAARAALEQTK